MFLLEIKAEEFKNNFINEFKRAKEWPTFCSFIVLEYLTSSSVSYVRYFQAAKGYIYHH